jgi:hypothetical protein
LLKTFAPRAAVLLFAFSLAPALIAQDAASMTGVVTDSSGAVIPGVQVTLANPATGVKYQGVTNAEGSYIISEVKPGPDYTATFSREGFTSVAVTGLYLNVTAVRTQDVVLAVGNVVTTVSVSGGNQNVTLDTTDATIGNNFEVQTVNELPVQIRDTPATLFVLQPGVTEDASGQFSVTGARTDQSHVTLDGLDVDDRGTGQFGSINGNAPVDSVQEFRGVTAGETSNFDSGGGGQFQLVTKSGTNQFHGALFEYHRDTDLEANNWFNNNSGVGRAPLIRNQFGGNLGGPILKNKLFFFFEYNGRRDNQGVAVDQTVPTPSFLAGNISYINNGAGCSPESTTLSAPQCISKVSAASVAMNYDPLGIGQDPALASFLAQRYPKGNDPTAGDGINTMGFRFNAPVILKENDYVARIDYNLTPNQKLFARASVLSQTQADAVNYATPIQFPGDPVTRAIDDASWAWVVGHNWAIGSTKTNQVSYGETISRLDFPAVYNPTGALQWGFGPLTAPYLGNYNSQGRVVPVPQLRDDFAWVKGVHTFSFGGTFKFITPYNNVVLNDYTPDLGISGVGLTQLDPTLRPADILQTSSSTPTTDWDDALVFDLGAFTQLGATFNYNADGSVQNMGAGTSRKYRYYETEVYFGDSWKVSPSLTLSYGLRYQLYTVPYEVNGIEAVQVNASTGKPLDFDEYFFRIASPRMPRASPVPPPFLSSNTCSRAKPTTTLPATTSPATRTSRRALPLPGTPPSTGVPSSMAPSASSTTTPSSARCRISRTTAPTSSSQRTIISTAPPPTLRARWLPIPASPGSTPFPRLPLLRPSPPPPFRTSIPPPLRPLSTALATTPSAPRSILISARRTRSWSTSACSTTSARAFS